VQNYWRFGNDMTWLRVMAWSVTADLFCSVAADLLVLRVYRPLRRSRCEVSRRRGVKRQCVIENVDFQCFRTLCPRHLRKWGQRYYIYSLVPCRLSTNPKIHHLEMTMNGHFTLNFHKTNSPFYVVTVESVYTRDQRRCTDVRKRTVIRRIFVICGKTADLS